MLATLRGSRLMVGLWVIMEILLLQLRTEFRPGAVKAFDVMIPEHTLPYPGYSNRPILQSPDQAFLAPLGLCGRQRRRSVRTDPEEGTELGMEAVEDHRAIPCFLLACGKARHNSRMIVPHRGRWLIDEPEPHLLQPVTDLDIFPRRVGKSKVEGLGEQQVAGEG